MPHRKRNRHGARFVRLEHFTLNSEAWLSLTPAARSVYIEIRRLYNGSNNGTLGLSVRRAAQRCRIAKDTAARAFRELEDRGFIECVQKGAYAYKKRHASEWRITDETCNVTGKLPTSLYQQWRAKKKNPDPNQTPKVLEEGQCIEDNHRKAA